tara:strand:+ start:975 stop:2162 length:1188 start_codon:yes stop_codon:yes gene_type:complete
MPSPTALSADIEIPSGNACILGIETASAVPEVHFAASAQGGPEAIWFHLRIRPGNPAPKTVRCVLRAFDTLLGNLPGAPVDGFHPVFRTERRDWTRCTRIQRLEEIDGQIQAAWDVPGDEGEIRTALCFPYTMIDLESLLNETGGFWEQATIGVSDRNRPLPRLYNQPGTDGSENPGIFCLARQHAAETPGSWVLDGFLRRMADLGDRAPLVWAVPFADIDGVHDGRAGKDAYPWDFNRSWGSKLFPENRYDEFGSHPMRQEVKCIQHDMLRWKKRCRPLLVLDFHAPVMRDASGIFCFLRDLDEAGQPDPKHAPWVRVIEAEIDPAMRSERFSRSGRYPSRWSRARLGDYVNRALELPMLTIETPYACSPHMIFTRDDYRQAGAAIANAMMQQI